MITFFQRPSSVFLAPGCCCVLVAGMFACFSPGAFAQAQSVQDEKARAIEHARRNAKGIWKAVVPPKGSTPGEFDGHDPVGLMSRQKIKTDCSINWINPDSHKRYCFTTPTSLVYFREWPAKNIGRAEAFWLEVGHKNGSEKKR